LRFFIDSRFPDVEILTDWSTCQPNTAQFIFDVSRGQSEFRLKKGEKVSEEKIFPDRYWWFLPYFS
jgi:hypothetical protein